MPRDYTDDITPRGSSPLTAKPIAWIILALGISLWILTLPLAAETPDPGLDPSLAALSRLGLEGTNLSVNVHWAEGLSLPEQAELRLLDASDSVAASMPLIPLAGGEMRVSLTNALGSVTHRGTQYALRVADGNGAPISPDLPLQIRLRCAADDPCSFEAIPGLLGSEIVLGRELSAALDEREAAGSTNLLTDVLATESHLRGEVFTLAMQMGSPSMKQGGCQCFWQTTIDEKTGMCWDHEHEPDHSSSRTPDWELRSWQGPGASFGVSYATDTGHELDWLFREGKSRLGLALRCWSIQPSTAVVVGMEGEVSDLQLSLPRAQPCGQACFSTTAEATIQMRAMTEALGSGSAEASLRARARVTDAQGSRLVSSLDLESLSWESEEGQIARTETLMGSEFEVSLAASGQISAGETKSSGGLLAQAASRVESYRLQLNASAHCGGEAIEANVFQKAAVPGVSDDFCSSDCGLASVSFPAATLIGTGPPEGHCGLIIDEWGNTGP